MGKKQIKELKTFLAKVQRKFGPAKVILFGSRALGEDWGRSDYDFIIISKDFEGMHWLDRISSIVEFWELDCDIDVLPYTPDEFKAKVKNSSLIRAMLKKSVVLV